MIDEAEVKATARVQVAELVRRFQRNEVENLRPTYNETQTRTEFITPLLAAFGWDVANRSGYPTGLREVIEEATVEDGEGLSKRPDYELRLARQRKLFVEAKKPSVAIDRSSEAAFQTRRYGYSASLPIAVLTNFYHLAVYDCVPAPARTDDAHVARLLLVRYDEFDTRFDELWSFLSRYAVFTGDFDRHFAIGGTRHGAEQFDDVFLCQVRSWRVRLAEDIYNNTPGLSPDELSFAVQLFLLRIVFLRICEDREIERYETLHNLPGANMFDSLISELRRADAFYNSGLFHLLDDSRLGIRISDAVLRAIINELYYPSSPYTFSVVETEILGEIYEQFLSEEITIAEGTVVIVPKPEVRESDGVVPTPRYIVDSIVASALIPALAGKMPADLTNFTVADICCGSGVFLLAVYELLKEHYLNWYLANNRADHVGRRIYEATAGNWRLTFEEKRHILCRHIRGVDIDAGAVEVTQFSLLLKLIESETKAALDDYITRQHEPALPNLSCIIRAGNSLVSHREWVAAVGTAIPEALIRKVNPFDWGTEFRAEIDRGGFDVIVGNPPYIRIQNMTGYAPEEVAFYKCPASPYSTAHQDNFDKYSLFFERALSLLSVSGRLSFITPHKFMTIQAGRALRRLLADGNRLESIVHFGAKQVFGRNVTNYTCIVVLDLLGSDNLRVEHVSSLEAWRYGNTGTVTTLPAASLTEEAWRFADAEIRSVFDRIRTACPIRLGTLAEIFVGIQTSADAIFIFRSVGETTDHHLLRWNGRDWPIEKGILRSFLLDVQLSAYNRPAANAWLIFPYTFVAVSGRTHACLLQPDEMWTQYPGCMAYLTERITELEDRAVTGGRDAERQFYQFGRSQSLVKFNSPKIILPALSLEPRYVYDDNNIVVAGGGNGPYYLLRHLAGHGVTNHFLLAVLNHPFSEAMIRTNTSVFRGGYYSHGKQFIKDLPVPIPSDEDRTRIDSLVNRLIAAHDNITAAHTPRDRTLFERQAANLRQEIEAQITQLLQLTSAEMEIIRAVPIPE